MSIDIYIYLDEWKAIESTCTDQYAWHLSEYTHISIAVCTMGPYIMLAYKYTIDI
jgi:hypothetical protein